MKVWLESQIGLLLKEWQCTTIILKTSVKMRLKMYLKEYTTRLNVFSSCNAQNYKLHLKMKKTYLTICTNDFASLTEEQDTIRWGNIKLKSLRSVLHQLSKEFEHWGGNLGIVAPNFNTPNQNTSIRRVTVYKVKENVEMTSEITHSCLVSSLSETFREK